MFSHIVGNDHIKAYLDRMVQRNVISNSMLFAGPDGIGKSLFAEAFARLIICADDPKLSHRHKLETGNHPDLHIYRPEGKIGMHSINAMRQFNEEVYLPPYETKRKVFIIHDADRMLPYSANALLKTFEEPSLDSVIILVSSSPELLLPTIMSRCRAVYFHLLSEDEIARVLVDKGALAEEEAKKLASLSRGSLGNAFRLMHGEQNTMREMVLQLFAQGKCTHYKDLADKAKQISDVIEQAAELVEETAKKDMIKESTEKLTAVQRQSLEKEVEGLGAMKTARDAQALFDVILSWHRDLHLLLVNGSPQYIFHKDYRQSLEQTIQRGGILTIEAVQKAVNDAKLALERSTSLHLCLESLFLRLNLL